MKLPQPSTVTFANGLRMVHLQHRNVGAGIFGVVVRAGSADESADEQGLAHLVEHTIFKGTRRRSPWHIINRMEAVGGELNAFTTKEETTVYSIYPGGNAARAIELVADLVLNSVFPDKEIDKEREVVLDEIYSYRDTPSDAVFDDFEDQVFAGSPVGHNILGTPESVRHLGSTDCRSFLDRFYTAGNIVAFYSGPQSQGRIAALVEKHFAPLAAGTGCQRRRDNIFVPSNNTVRLDGLHQSHAALGIPVASVFSDARFADFLFANLIGGPGMNSLLNVELRERRGLVYNVEANSSHFSSGGLLTVYFGCDADDTDRCLQICRDTMRRLADMADASLARNLAKAKRQYLGQLAVGSENRENRIMSIARELLYKNELSPEGYVRNTIEAVQPADIKVLATQLANPSTLIYLPK